jgi:carboxyl-terminal processing protease
MSSRTRVIVMSISAPVIAFAIVGGFLGKVMAREDTYQHLKIFDDVVSLISSSYVETADIDKVMKGAMHGLAEGLDPDSAYLTADQVKQVETGAPLAPGGVGLELTRQYYLRVISARDGSPAARAGLQPGDYIRGIDGQSTRDTSVFEGTRLLRGKPGTKVRLTVLRGNAADPHEVELTREELPALSAKGRIAAPGTGYVRIAEFGKSTPDQIKSEVASLQKTGATRLVLDLRGNSFGDVEAVRAYRDARLPAGSGQGEGSDCRQRR